MRGSKAIRVGRLHDSCVMGLRQLHGHLTMPDSRAMHGANWGNE